MVTRVKVNLNGTLGTSEVWSVGLHFAPDDGEVMTPIQAQAVATALPAGLATWWAASSTSQMKALLGAQGQITSVSVYGYGPSGPASAQGAATLGTPLVGTANSTAPPQCSSVMSLLTDRPGSSYRGRIYWPALTPSLSTSLVSSIAQASGPGLVGLIATIQTALLEAGPYTPVVYSQARNEVTEVTRVRVGNVIDTQRRRRDALPESYTTVGIP